MSRVTVARLVAVLAIAVGATLVLSPKEARAAGGHCHFDTCGYIFPGGHPFETCVFSATRNCKFVGGQCTSSDCFDT
jgi:hypothetical protein